MTTISDATGFGFKQFRNFTIEDARNMARFVQVSCSQFPNNSYNK